MDLRDATLSAGRGAFARAGATRTFLALVAAVLCSAGLSLAANGFTIEDLLKAEDVRELDLSPDGSLAVWVRSTVEKVDGEEKRVSNLWLTRLGSGESMQLTRGTDTLSSPEFSPDGRTIAFLSNRALPGGKKEDAEPKTNLWGITVGGGESFPITRLDRDVKTFGWKDPKNLIVSAPESASLWEMERKETKDTSVVVDDAERTPPVRLFLATLGEETVKRLTRNADWIDSLSVSPDGKRAVITTQRSLSYEYDQKLAPSTYLLDLNTLEGRRILEDGTILPRDVRWAPDSSGFFLTNEYTHSPKYRIATVTELHFYTLAGGRVEKVELGTNRGLGGAYAPTPSGCLTLLNDGVRLRPARFTREGAKWKREDIQGAHAANLDTWSLSRDGKTLAYRYSSATVPPQWYVGRLEEARIVDPRKITDLNRGFEGKPTGRVEPIRWFGARGDSVEGLLLYPIDYKEGEKRPLILDIHGGPTGVDRDSWSSSWYSPHLLWRQEGAFVLQVNYHGSTGYGLDWAESIAGGKYYELEISDIETGVDSLVTRGLVDATRLATSGWSNGGILSAELITRTRRYRAASIGAADVEWFSDWANVDFGAAFDSYYFGGSPLEKPQVYLEKSPFFRLASVTTPTITFAGTDDRNVPPNQAWSLFRALQQATKTDARLVLFPGEPHGLRKIAHQRRKLEEEVAWLDAHLFDTPPTGREAVKKGSLLDALLARQAASHAGASLGALESGILVPETARYEGLEIGRFEVTRGQYAAFDPEYQVSPGERDLPVTGIPFEKARAYTGWLAVKTGRPFRLPTVAEAERLAKAAGTGGNTLDRWAGYAPNPEDAARLRRLAEDLHRPGALLLPVGTLAGAGDPPVFDLDGNAAEWASAGGDKGIATGPSADRPARPGDEVSPPDASYVGFRLVVGPAQ